MAITDKLTAIANAIRTKSGKTATMTLDEMPTEIENLPTGTSYPSYAYATNYIGTTLDEVLDVIECLPLTESQLIYFICDTRVAEEKRKMALRPSQSGTMQRGHIANGTFVVDATMSISATAYWNEVIPNDYDLVVYKFTSTSNIQRIDNNTTSTTNAPIVAIYGKLPYLNRADQFTSGSNMQNMMYYEMNNAQYQMTIGSTSTTSTNSMQKWVANNGNINLANNLFYASQVKEIEMNNLTMTGTTLGGAFNSCFKLKSIKFGTTSSTITSMKQTFYQCSALDNLDLSWLDASAVTDASNCFGGCTNLTNIVGWCRNLKVSFDLSACPLTFDSLMKVIMGLPSVTTSPTLTLGTANKTKAGLLVGVAEGKGWTVA